MKSLKILIKRIINLYGWELIKKRKPPSPNPYGKINYDVLKALNDCNGILHLGAHRGTEAEVYNWFGKNVAWVEANPEIYQELKLHLQFYKNQIPLLALLSDNDGEVLNFHISNNDGACSSMFEFSDEINKSEIWKNRNFEMVKTLKIKSISLDSLFKKNSLDPKDYNHWIMDLQGSELKCLKGAEKSLNYCKSIYIEVSKKQFYKNAVIWDELNHWLNSKNFYSKETPYKDEEDILFLRN